jgi:hypothetical protein
MSLATCPPTRAISPGVQDLAHVLGVEPGRECRRADQIDEHHRELTPLGLG